MKKLILIRHGETDYTLQRKYCGHEDILLSANGIQQAKCLGAKLEKIKIDRVYSSDLGRALQTAEIVFPKQSIIRRKGLREIDVGRFSGLTFEEAEKRYPRIYRMWRDNLSSVKIPKGEKVSDFAKRVRKCSQEIFDHNSGKKVAIVSHGGPIRIILLRMLKQDLDKFWRIEQNVAAVNIVEFKGGEPKILKVNDTSHLD